VVAHRLAVGVHVERAGDTRAALGYSFQDRGRGRINLRHAAKIEFEVGCVCGKRGCTGVLQSSHVSDAQPAADLDTEEVAMTR
jgi:hypothetical protein